MSSEWGSDIYASWGRDGVLQGPALLAPGQERIPNTLPSVEDPATYGAELLRLERDAERLVRRLRNLTTQRWSSRRESVTALLVELADLGARAEKRESRTVPTLPDHSLPDALSVLAGDLVDALAAAPSPALLAISVQAVRRASSETT